MKTINIDTINNDRVMPTARGTYLCRYAGTNFFLVISDTKVGFMYTTGFCQHYEINNKEGINYRWQGSVVLAKITIDGV